MAIATIIAISIFFTESGEAQYPCFYGYTYVDGQLRGRVPVHLQIEGEDPITVYSVDWGERFGSYSIGTSAMSGEYCLRARKLDTEPHKGDTHQGTKGIGGIRRDLYLTSIFSECEHTE